MVFKVHIIFSNIDADKVRTHCWEPLEKRYDSEINLFLISSFHLNKYDGPKLLHCLLKSISDPKEKKQYILNDGKYLKVIEFAGILICGKFFTFLIMF